MDELHMSHIGIVKMKDVSRRYFWWPGITKSVEETAAKCKACLKFRKCPSKQAACPWPYARRPMERVHIDFMEYKGQMILIMVDAYSKKIWSANMGTSTTSTKTLNVLYTWFATETGFPTTLVSDNGPQLVSSLFETMMGRWGIKHLLSPPYHPASNGLAERAVGIVKGRLKRMDAKSTPVMLNVALQLICRVHGLTPNTSTGRCPFELMREAPMPSLFPRLTQSVQRKSELTAVQQSTRGSGRKVAFAQGDTVNVFDFHTKRTSLGIVRKVLGHNTYAVECHSGIKHVSGDALSKSRLTYQEERKPELTAQQDQHPLQDDHLGQRQSDVVVESDSDDDDDDFFQHRLLPLPAAVAAAPRRRVRDMGLGPVLPTRLRHRP